MRIASYGAAATTIARANACSSWAALAAWTASIDEHVCHSHQLSASMSSSRGGRPARRAAAAICTQTAGPKSAVKSLSVAGRRHGSSTSSTSWPSVARAARCGVERGARADRVELGLAAAASVVTPIRRRPGVARRGRGERLGRRRRPRGVAELGPGEDVEERRRLGTVRVRTPSAGGSSRPASGAFETRPREAFRPTRPQHAAGIRSEPPPSLPCAIGTIPAATAAAEPPDEPPGVRSRSHGLRVGPPRRGSVTGRIPHSGSVGRADDDEARRAQAPDDVVVVLRDGVAHEVGAARQAHAADRRGCS